MTNIAERPPDVAGRTVPGHQKVGKREASAGGTLVERTTRRLILVRLPPTRPS